MLHILCKNYLWCSRIIYKHHHQHTHREVALKGRMNNEGMRGSVLGTEGKLKASRSFKFKHFDLGWY
jgi:hypothetical protein